MKKLFFLLLPMMAAIWLTTLGGCRKCKGIEGRVLEFGTETPIPNATVTLSDCTGSLGSSLVCTDVATAVTDSKGRFNFKADGFSVAAKAPDYWDTGDDFEMVVNECPKPFLYLYPNATVNVTIKNESGAYRFIHGNDVDLKLSVGDESTFTEFVRGNFLHKFIFDIESTQNDTTRTTIDDLLKIKIFDKESNILITSLENSWSPWFEYFPTGHQTTKITIIY
jgi:hypothetical protein